MRVRWIVFVAGLGVLGGLASCRENATAPAATSSRNAGNVESITRENRRIAAVRWPPTAGQREIALWPSTASTARPEIDAAETIVSGSKPVAGRPWSAVMNVSKPTMTIYPPKGRNTGAATMVFPGGGYAVLAIDLEGTEICDWITAQGMTCILLKYRVPQDWRSNKRRTERAPTPQFALQDAQRAMSLVRHRAVAWGVSPDKIGVIGFSAGGHLAQAISNAERRSYAPVDAADETSSRPDFAIVLYPGHIRDSSGGRGSASTHLASWIHISRDAPPTFIVHSVDDPVDSVYQSFAYGLALKKANVPFEMHLYAEGGHAFGLRPSRHRVTVEWPALAAKWLHALKML